MTENDIAAASASMVGANVVPLRWITTCDALESLVSDGAGAADLLKAESAIDAVKAKTLKALALVRKGTEWEEYPLPTAYWETASGSDALWTGEVVAMSLPAQSKWLDSKPLCFLRAEWEAWLAGHPPATALRCGAGNTAHNDVAQIDRALSLFDAGTYKSIRAAARSFMKDIPGDGHPESKARRVADKALKVIRARRQ